MTRGHRCQAVLISLTRYDVEHTLSDNKMYSALCGQVYAMPHS